MADLDGGVGRDMIRAGCGSVLFGVPLLYTMELWWTGSGSSPAFSLGLVVAVLVAATIIDRTAGFRFAQLVPLVIGASIANEIFGSGSAAPPNPEPPSTAHRLGSLLGGAFLGAVVVALAIAPTDEVVIVAGRASLWHLLALIVVSLVASHGIVFSADFAGSNDLRRPRTLDELAHTALAYIVALVAAGLMLALYGRFDSLSALTVWSRVIALGFPAAIGAAAGRLAL